MLRTGRTQLLKFWPTNNTRKKNPDKISQENTLFDLKFYWKEILFYFSSLCRWQNPFGNNVFWSPTSKSRFLHLWIFFFSLMLNSSLRNKLEELNLTFFKTESFIPAFFVRRPLLHFSRRALVFLFGTGSFIQDCSKRD